MLLKIWLNLHSLRVINWFRYSGVTATTQHDDETESALLIVDDGNVLLEEEEKSTLWWQNWSQFWPALRNMYLRGRFTIWFDFQNSHSYVVKCK